MIITLDTIKNLKKSCLGFFCLKQDFKTWFEENIKEKVDLQELKARLEKDKEWRLLRLLYENGFLNGELKSYYENGNLFQINNWQDGKKHGAYKRYWCDGNVQSEGNYVNGQQHGLQKLYCFGGIAEEEGVYINGQKQGMFKRFRLLGLPTEITECYINGELIKQN